ncbi:hypothetical protein PHET_08470 [Paragonimus heterotremus]|uniref:C-type lectin domain-containing protein n=1 Tax=Paragonimus heterotremus TaxID=100268 RepID=A0A8J4T554_9TREM|nr:hypothetical protein PHET_08470 [Paragonimus heterotremus]
MAVKVVESRGKMPLVQHIFKVALLLLCVITLIGGKTKLFRIGHKLIYERAETVCQAYRGKIVAPTKEQKKEYLDVREGKVALWPARIVNGCFVGTSDPTEVFKWSPYADFHLFRNACIAVTRDEMLDLVPCSIPLTIICELDESLLNPKHKMELTNHPPPHDIVVVLRTK